jgi:hypothetical protein
MTARQRPSICPEVASETRTKPSQVARTRWLRWHFLGAETSHGDVRVVHWVCEAWLARQHKSLNPRALRSVELSNLSTSLRPRPTKRLAD